MPQTNSIFEVRRFCDAITSAGGRLPAPLANLLANADLVDGHSAAVTPVKGLVDALVAGKMTAQKLTAAVEAAAQQQSIANFVGNDLRPAVEPELVTRFHAELEAGAADQILDSLRERFAQAAEQIAEAKSVLGSGESSLEHIVASSDKPDDVVRAWRSLPRHIGTVAAITAIASQFGCRQTASFSLVQVYGLADNHLVDDRALAATTGGLVNDSALMMQMDRGGTTSPFYRCGGLRLHSIEEMRARYAEFAAAEFDRVHGGLRGGHIGEDGLVHTDPVPPNPFRKEEAA